MAEYRFFGSESVLRGGLPLTKYGQRVALEPDEANALIAAHPPALLLPADLWDKCGITDEELAEFPSAEIHGAAPEDFREKTKAVRMAWHAYREDLIARLRTEAPSIPLSSGVGPSIVDPLRGTSSARAIPDAELADRPLID